MVDSARFSHPGDFEEVALADNPPPKFHSATPAPQVRRSPRNSDSLDEDAGMSNVSTPTLTSDTSSLRSSMSSMSSPALHSYNISSSGSAMYSPNSVMASPRRKSTPGTLFGMGIDTTSMASLSRIPSIRSNRSRKQREQEYENDEGEDFWPSGGLMFNVPMSPALYRQQQQQQHQNQHTSQLRSPQAPVAQTVPKKQQRGSSASLPSISEYGQSTRSSSRGDLTYGAASQESLTSQSAWPAHVPSNVPGVHTDRARHSHFQGLDAEASDLTLQFALEEEARATNLQLPPKKSISDDDEVSSRRSSLTRPEGLPPKDPAEEAAHLREYEKMVAQAISKERRRSEHEQRTAAKRAQQQQNDAQTWHLWVHNNGSTHISRELKWRGVPESQRRFVWRLQLVKGPKVTLQSHPLNFDAEAVWPELAIFQENRPLHDSLKMVVGTYLANVPGVIQQQPVASLAALLLLYLDENESAQALLHLLGPGTMPHAVLTGLEQVATANSAAFAKVFRDRFPRLADHCTAAGLIPHELLNLMIVGCVSSVLARAEAAARVIDVLAFEGEPFLIRAALGLLRTNEAWLFGSRSEIIYQLQHSRVPSDDELMETIRNVTL